MCSPGLSIRVRCARAAARHQTLSNSNELSKPQPKWGQVARVMRRILAHQSEVSNDSTASYYIPEFWHYGVKTLALLCACEPYHAKTFYIRGNGHD
jgi:hypothetical protein